MVSSTPAKKVPFTTQHMWEVAVQDLELEEARGKLIRQMDGVTPERITDSERRIRVRQAICNAIDFLITNKDDVSAVIESNRRKRK
jgi:hypothetical protein